MAMENTSVVSSEKRIAVVTGGNKGIGFEICRQLASNDIIIILTARNESQGLEAVKKLNGYGLINVIFHQLDVKDPASAARLAKYVETQFKKLDILVNNAGVNGTIIHCDELRAFKESGYQVCDENAHLLVNKVFEEPYNLGKDCIETNYYGTKRVTEAFLPLLQLSNSPRIVNITSFYGELHWIHNEEVKAELLDIDNLTEERIDGITQQFLRDFETDNLSKNGWPLTTAAYKISKIVITAYTRLIARKFPKILANCVHPGYVKTDITSNFGHMTPEDGAKAPVMVALLGDDGPSGVYFNQMRISSF
uniref:short-chain dehydrogenase/reductase 2b-like n=1 Tax=Erigeron canadensis TaxID=72917 RepID=UPI001CB90A9D|nr:short-chain dehydrogenase/reductase 2b-like [Erigeron canadensis]XP_043635675.1 short-chain dehydrogenase/reductase 2b-like [Erigeron canadensis]